MLNDNSTKPTESKLLNSSILENIERTKIFEVIQYIGDKSTDIDVMGIATFVNTIDPIINQKRPARIAIYGAGKFCRALLYYLRLCRPNLYNKVICIIDTYISGIKIDGISVTSLPLAAQEYAPDMIIISVASKNDEIYSLLQKFDGFKGDIITFPDDLVDEQLFFSMADIQTALNKKEMIVHIKRYMFALPYCISKKVLDIACGCGYGSNLLSSRANFVLGGDINNKALQYANTNYLEKNLEFREVNIYDMKDIGKFDTIVSFETIEHLPPEQTDLYFKNLKKSLTENGIFIISSPHAAKDGQSKCNRYHTNEMTLDTFTKVVKTYFSDFDIYIQDTEENGNIDYIDLAQIEDNAYAYRYVYIFVCYNH